MRNTSSTLLMIALSLLCVSAGPARREVSIQNSAYNPAALTIALGDTVVWTNNDDRDHTITASDGSFTSGNLGAGATFEHTFAKPGSFAYGCKYHPRMKGQIVANAK